MLVAGYTVDHGSFTLRAPDLIMTLFSVVVSLVKAELSQLSSKVRLLGHLYIS